MILVGDSVVSTSVFRSCPVSYPNRDTWFDLVELDRFYFDVILEMDWLHACFVFIDCRTRLAK